MVRCEMRAATKDPTPAECALWANPRSSAKHLKQDLQTSQQSAGAFSAGRVYSIPRSPSGHGRSRASGAARSAEPQLRYQTAVTQRPLYWGSVLSKLLGNKGGGQSCGW